MRRGARPCARIVLGEHGGEQSKRDVEVSGVEQRCIFLRPGRGGETGSCVERAVRKGDEPGGGCLRKVEDRRCEPERSVGLGVGGRSVAV